MLNLFKYITSLHLILLVFFYSFLFNLDAQHRYWIYFKDKSGSEFNPYQYFSSGAIERRIKHGISLTDSSDFPVSEKYIKIIEKLFGTINTSSRWFNAVTVLLNDEQAERIKDLPFVTKIEHCQQIKMQLATTYDTLLKNDGKKLLDFQIKRMEGNLFIENGFSGKGMRIAVFDAGFPLVNKIMVFEHLFKNNLIKASWDFARKKTDVYTGNQHGTMVLSCIAGILNNKHMGLASDCEFLLARTEVDRESMTEEEYWLQAVEWADKNGADIINSSVVYTFERYYTFEMNGHTSLVSRAANMAADKGILVVCAMGNDGNADWKILGTPADADSVISVGAISPLTDFHAGFSSFGPTASYKRKPNVVMPGRAIVAGKSGLEKAEGTSFAAPLLTGFAACAWQTMPYLTNMQLFGKIEQSGHLFPYYDYAHGYGVPQASFFVMNDRKIVNEPTFEMRIQDDTLYITVDTKFIDKKNPNSNNYLYYHIENENSYLEAYWLIDVFSKNAVSLNLDEWPRAKVIRAHYKGFTNEIRL